MHKSFVLVTGLVLALSGCQSKSPTWQKVIATSKAVGDAEDKPKAYAGELHRTLAEASIPHKVVTFEFGYAGRFDQFMTTRRTAVIYQDSASIKHPWWLMDRTLDRPVWLPTGSVEKQVSFYVRRPATVVDVQDYVGFDDKDILPEDGPKRTGTTRIERVEAKPVKYVPAASRTEAAEPAPKRKGIFQRGIFAPRPPKTEPVAVQKTEATSTIQTTTGSKPVRVDVVQPTKKAAAEKPAPAPKKAAPAPAKPTQERPSDATPPKPAKKAAKPDATLSSKKAPKAAAIPWDRPEPWEEPAPAPVPAETKAIGIRAAQASPKPGARARSAPLFNQPADKPKENTPAEQPKSKPKFRGPLISHPEDTPATQPSADATRPGLLRRILDGLNPKRLFTRA